MMKMFGGGVIQRTFQAAFRTYLALIVSMLFLVACDTGKNPYQKFEPKPGKGIDTSDVIYGVVEIPAGTSIVQRLDTLTGRIVPLQDSVANLDFLSFPGNYGFISSTYKTDPATGKGRALPVLVLCDHLETGSVLPVIPVATMKLVVNNSPEELIVAIPLEKELRSIQASSFVDLYTKYDAVRNILQTWFVAYRGYGHTRFRGWEDETYARKLIEKWRIQPEI